MIKKVIFHSFLYSVPSISLQIVSLLILPFITPHLTAVDYGVYGIIIAYISFVAPLRDLGFGIVFVNSFFRNPKRWPIIWRALYGHLIIWSVLYFVIISVLVIIAVPQNESYNLPLILFLTIIPNVIFDTANTIGNYYFRFREKPIVVAAVGFLSGGVGIAVMYYFIAIKKVGYIGWFYSTFATSAVIFLIYFYPVFIKKRLFPIIRFRPGFIKKYLRISLPLVPHNYSSYLLNSSDRVIMDWYKIELNQVGLYNIAYRFGNAFEMIGESVGMAVGPQFTKLYISKLRTDLEIARQLTFFLMALFLIAGFNGAIWLKEIFILLIKNKELASAYSVGIIVLMGYCYKPMYLATINKLMTFERTNIIWKISFGAGILNVILNLIFLERYGIMGAAIATFISLMVIGFSGFLLKAYREMDNLPHYPIVWLTSIISATILAYGLRDISIGIKFLISILSLLAIAYFLRKILFKLK